MTFIKNDAMEIFEEISPAVKAFPQEITSSSSKHETSSLIPFGLPGS
jgi:hypothetical protein